MGNIEEESKHTKNAQDDKDWPIEPSFLSIRADKDRLDRNFSPNKDGLFYPNELRGILADASATFWEKKEDENFIGKGQVFALFQVVPESFQPFFGDRRWPWFVEFNNAENKIIKDILKDRKILRIHPGSLYPNIEGCEFFRKCKRKNEAGEEIECKVNCFEMDSRIALLYDEKLRIIPKDKEGKNDWDKFYFTLNEIINEYNKQIRQEESYRNDVDNIELYILQPGRHDYQTNGKTERRPFVGYRCIYSGLMEYFFPITHAGKVIAVLMRGQCPVKDLKKEMMYKGYRGQIVGLDRWIEKKYDDDNLNINKDDKEKLFYLEQTPDAVTKETSKLIETLENRIENAITARYQEYLSAKFFRIERQFRNVSSKIQKTKTDISTIDQLEALRKEISNLGIYLKRYERLLNITLRAIISRFNLDTKENFIRIYAIESDISSRINQKKDSFRIIGDSTFVTLPANRKYTIDTLSDTRKYRKIILNKIKERDKTLDTNGLFKERGTEEAYFPKRYQEKLEGFYAETDFIHVEFSFSPQVAYLIWERYTDWDKNSDQFKEFRSYLNLMNHTLLEPYIILEKIRLGKDLESTMRISSHETAQIIPDVIHTINNPDTLKALEEDTLMEAKEITIPANKIIDSSRRLYLLNNLSRRLSNIFKEQKPKFERADFHRIIYAPKSLYERRARINNRQQIIVSSSNEIDRYDLMTHYEYLSHILFNLMDNAIKHGLRGSKIHIKAILEYEKEADDKGVHDVKEATISVISYGAKIEDEDKENMFDLFYRSTSAKGEGMGIGLFLVKKLCKLLEYEIKYTSTWISDEHLPVKYHYYRQNQKYYAESYLHDEVVNKNVSNWRITTREKDVLLRRPTWKNEFKIIIPLDYETLRKKN